MANLAKYLKLRQYMADAEAYLGRYTADVGA